MNPFHTLGQESPEKSEEFRSNIPANKLVPEQENLLSNNTAQEPSPKSEKNQNYLPAKYLPESQKKFESPSQETKNMEQFKKNSKFKEDIEEEEEKDVSSRMLKPDMGFCRNIEDYVKFNLMDSRRKLLDLQVKRNHEKSEGERKMLEEDIKVYEQMIENIKKDLAKDTQDPQIHFDPIKEVPSMSFIFY